MTSVHVLHLCVFLIVLFVAVPLGANKSGKYKINVQTIKQCNDPGTKQLYMSSANLNKTDGVFNGTFIFGVPVDESFTFRIDLQQVKDGVARQFLLYSIVGCTKIMNMIGDYAQRLYKSAGVDLKGCPLPAGNYTATNMEFKVSPKQIPMIVFGFYRLEINGFYNGVKIGCIIFEAFVVSIEQ